MVKVALKETKKGVNMLKKIGNQKKDIRRKTKLSFEEKAEREQRIAIMRRKEAALNESILKKYSEDMIGGSCKKLVLNKSDSDKVTFDSIEGVENITRQFAPNLTWEVISKFRQTFIGWQNCAILMQNAIISNACTLPPRKAMMMGYKLSFQKVKKNTNQLKLDEMERLSAEKYKIQDVCIQSAINAFEYGYSLSIPTFNEDVDMSVPFNVDMVKKSSYTGMTTVEPYWIVPQLDTPELIEPWKQNFFDPTYYIIGGLKKIHRSWCVKNIPYPIGDILKPAYFYGGVPLVQMIYEDVYAYEKAVNELLQLLLTKRTACVEGDMMNAMLNPEEFNQKMRLSSETKDNYGLLAVDLDSNVKQFDTTLTGLSETIECLQDRLCAKTQMSPADLFKKIIKGGANSGAGKFERYDVNNNLVKIQNTQYLPILNFHNLLMTKSEYGVAIPLETTFNPIDSPDEITRAQIRDYNTKSSMMRIGAHLTTKQEERLRMANDPNDAWITLSPDLPEELKGENQSVQGSQLEKSFSAEKDNQGRPLPKEKDDLVRGKNKDDIVE